jgi:hypothetical protein
VRMDRDVLRAGSCGSGFAGWASTKDLRLL